MKKMNNNSFNFMKFIVFALVFALLGVSSSFAQRSLSTGRDLPTASNPLGQSVAGTGMMNMQLPLFVGGTFGLGSGAGVGDNGHGVGLCQIKPMLGVWLPGYAFLRLGYGFTSYEEKDDDDKKVEVENSNFSVELGFHILSEFYVVGSYSRANALSENGDVSWNEWSVGVGSFWAVFSRTFLMFEIGHYWVREHYDPFIEKKVSGRRFQMNFGFVVFVY